MLAEENREGGGHNWEKYFIGLFHVSEHLGHSKAIKKSRKKTEIVWLGGTSPPQFGKRPNYFRFFLMKASLRELVGDTEGDVDMERITHITVDIQERWRRGAQQAEFYFFRKYLLSFI